jgi:hypothetical protein
LILFDANASESVACKAEAALSIPDFSTEGDFIVTL